MLGGSVVVAPSTPKTSMRNLASSVSPVGSPTAANFKGKSCEFCTRKVCKNCSLKRYKYPCSDNIGRICRICEAKLLMKVQYDLTSKNLDQVISRKNALKQQVDKMQEDK